MRTLGAALFPLILLASSTTAAQKKGPDPKKKTEYTKGPVGKAPAPCGARILPLVEGNKWTYEFVESGLPPREDMVKLSPSQPMEVVITVKSVETKGPDTVITLEEKTKADLSKDPKKHIYDERTLTSTITCNRTKFEISPESFFFAGEPGGYFGLAFDKFDRSKDTSLKLVNGAIGEGQWREEIVAHFSRTPFQDSGAKLDSGKLELERAFTPQPPESVNTKAGLYAGAEHLALVTTGRVTLDHPQGEGKPLDLPANWLTQMWLVPNAGVVQVLNAYAHKYILASAQLK
ncbi:MAG: hypothetical protein E6J90_32590 [Deltaproteobacteria bacterium]|nr:MAG: hypothetical protein E6J91_28415 [Deltaproteobacteria bacterium]TMQ12102.1 MAG: hypothetical protein E6J90_32590 [Deltaproteobacteria bacterium]